MKRRRLFGGVVGVAAVLLTSVSSAQELDSVVKRGTPTYGMITAMSRSEISISSKSGDKKFSVNEVQKVTFKGDPRELRSARDAIRKGQIETARSYLNEIDTDSISRIEILQDIEFYKAFCDGQLALTGGGDKAAAVVALRAYEDGVAKNDNYHYYEAMQLLGDLAVAMARLDYAVDYYGKLEQAPWPDYQMRAKVLQADALLASEKIEAALQKYDEVLQSGLDDAEAREQELMATLGKAVCLAATGQAAQGIESVLQIIQENDSRERPQLFARAYNALGTCYLKADQPKDALLSFLHVDLLFNQTPAAHAESLYYLSQLWRDVNKAERAIRARSVLDNRYSGSPWANRK